MAEAEIIKWIVVGLMSIGVWFMKRTIDKVEDDVTEVKRAIQQIKQDYLHKEDFKDFKVELRSMFEEIKSDIRALPKH
jgi:two-component SAPR family response regulator